METSAASSVFNAIWRVQRAFEGQVVPALVTSRHLARTLRDVEHHRERRPTELIAKVGAAARKRANDPVGMNQKVQ